ncbi:MAG TPA: glycosyltransferase [Verrucomicrobiae bacterium]|nr:glycosyltransferase [Verrucomicrobiae bacterium]
MSDTRIRRRVLLITNALPPAMQADNQRARMLADELPASGWDVELLVPDSSFQIPIYCDVKSMALRPKNTAINEVPPATDWLLRAAGMKSMSWRALWPMCWRGLRLLRQAKFDLIYISTAQFNFFCLGTIWHKKTGVPYVLDFHDPWIRESNQHITAPRNWKYRLGIRLAKHMECFAVRHAAGLVAVSPDYLEQLRMRYPGFHGVQPHLTAVIPFAGDARDMEVARQAIPPENGRCPTDLEIVYVGAGRSLMTKSFQRICRGLARIKQVEPKLAARIKIRLRGTYAYWKPGDPTELRSLAQAEGVGEMVEEIPGRIGYVDAVRLALDADGLLVLGVDDPAYMPSKLFLYAMTGKPLLASMHVHSQVNEYFRRFPELGSLIHFEGPAEDQDAEDASLLGYLKQVAERKTFVRENIRAEFSAAAMARRHAELFEKVVASSRKKLNGEGMF